MKSSNAVAFAVSLAIIAGAPSIRADVLTLALTSVDA